MTDNIEQARETIRRCLTLREAGKVEAVLRGEIQSNLRKIFPAAEDENWLNHYVEGTEAHTKVGTASGSTLNRFIDNLIGSTTIEYESDLRIKSKLEQGTKQVREHAAGLLRAGVPVSQVRGILSDSVEWYAYDIQLTDTISPEHCTPEDIILTEVDRLRLAEADEDSAHNFVGFLRKHLVS